MVRALVAALGFRSERMQLQEPGKTLQTNETRFYSSSMWTCGLYLLMHFLVTIIYHDPHRHWVGADQYTPMRDAGPAVLVVVGVCKRW